MAEQYEHMTLDIEDGKVINVDKPKVKTGPIWGSNISGYFEPRPESLVNKSVAFALNQLSAQKWEVIHMPPGDSQSGFSGNPFPSWPGLAPKSTGASKYQILLRRVISK